MVNTIDTLIRAEEVLYPAITKSLSDQSSKKFNDDQWTLSDLDQWRLRDLPQTVKERVEKHGETWLTKEELTLLIEWKLAKGVFRPSIRKLVQENLPEKVRDATRQGFQVLMEFTKKQISATFWAQATEKDFKDYKTTVQAAVKRICELRGVGPAAASLILSLWSKTNAQLAPPFFSDESFLYYVVERTRPGSKIKYNIKEYIDELFPVFFGILQKTKSSKKLDMTVLERGGWALKMYDIYKIDRLADISVDMKLEGRILVKFDIDDIHDGKDGFKRELEDNKDKATTKKRKKKN